VRPPVSTNDMRTAPPPTRITSLMRPQNPHHKPVKRAADPAKASPSAAEAAGPGIGTVRPMCGPTPQAHHVCMTSTSTLSIRTATDADDAVLARLSALDSARSIRRPALVALVDGRPVAATSLADGRTVADPFTPTADVVRVLRAAA
jgi:hypothetical protein